MKANCRPAGVRTRRLSVAILLLVAIAGVCCLADGARPARQPDPGPQVRHRPESPPLPELLLIPTNLPALIRWEKGPWWDDLRSQPPSVFLTNLRTRAVVLGSSAAAQPRCLTVQDLMLATPGREPLTLVLVNTGNEHPLRVLGACGVPTNTTIRVDNAALEVAGSFRVGGRLELARGRVAAESDLLVGESAGAPALVNVTGGTLTATNYRHNARLIIGGDGRGEFCLNGGTVKADFIQISNDAHNRFVFKSGTLRARTLVVPNGGPITIGDGIHPARLELIGGTNLLSSLLTVSSNATLLGSGTIHGPVANYGTIVAGRPGDQLTFAPLPPGCPSAVTNWGRMYMTNGGVLSFQGTAGNHVALPITEMTRTSGGFRFQLVSVGGLTHTLRYKDDLSDVNWTPVASTTGTGEIVSLTDPAPTERARYYHIHMGR